MSVKRSSTVLANWLLHCIDHLALVLDHSVLVEH